VNEDFALGRHLAELVDGLAPVGGAVGRLGGRYDQRRRVSVPRQLVSLVLVQFLAVTVPVHLSRRVTRADAAAEHRLLRGQQRCIVEILQQLRSSAG